MAFEDCRLPDSTARHSRRHPRALPLGRALGAEGDVGGATEACRASIRYKEELYGTDSVEVADAHNELSVLLQQTGDVEKAEVEASVAELDARLLVLLGVPSFHDERSSGRRAGARSGWMLVAR